ncbi:hypothetical protein AK830_g3721 [Neonectria ditissima]|uniref:Xylanolytic transcriptional activator regulatory domain-containing protein n=1 Tax=Neonectria ditissima TaxID=78410 RepID=A0A0P7BAZ4_9HYPO|nr:hypothetical protein AK830_g3721 [Neonectria ditissima]
MDAMILEKPDATFEMPSWWNRVRMGYPDNQALEGDLSLLFWGIPDPFCTLPPGTDPTAEQEYWNFGPLPSPFVAESSQLYVRVNLLAAEMNKLNHDPASAAMFTESNFLAFISAFYRYRHSQMPFIHWPTFDPDTASLPLLLAVALAGALFAHSPNDLSSQPLRPSQTLCDTAETFIFSNLEAFDQAPAHSYVKPSVDAVETCQAALLMELTQSSFNCYKTRRRILTKRHAYLVAILRSLGVFRTKHMPEQGKSSWQDFMQVESIIKLAIATFFADAMFVLYLNHPPCTTISEMMGDMPCDERLWSAETEVEFEAQQTLIESSWRPPSLREMIPGLFEDQWTEVNKKILQRLSLHDLHILLWGEFNPQ